VVIVVIVVTLECMLIRVIAGTAPEASWIATLVTEPRAHHAQSIATDFIVGIRLLAAAVRLLAIRPAAPQNAAP
jgi:hypothetical protein